ncbi:hypothetical protein BJ878DRAFT_26789 [Calycina marina]|uniref:Uncharacterized protein n=1 Tax=Calycina marina TaxID=1763456 RepID=A0A9P7ZBP6_9HELO|nr:hypothetical protein BJ878DRAFT_26789 [Calycina marina]
MNHRKPGKSTNSLNLTNSLDPGEAPLLVPRAFSVAIFTFQNSQPTKPAPRLPSTRRYQPQELPGKIYKTSSISTDLLVKKTLAKNIPPAILRKMRPHPILAAVLAFIGFILAMLSLLAGSVSIPGRLGGMEYAYVLRYDYSTFDSASNVVTKRDWATIHVLSVCHGGPNINTQCYPSRDGTLNGKNVHTKGHFSFKIAGLALIITLSFESALCAIGGILCILLARGNKAIALALNVSLMGAAVFGSIAALIGVIFTFSNTQITDAHLAPCTFSKVWIGILCTAWLSPLLATFFIKLESSYEKLAGKPAEEIELAKK